MPPSTTISVPVMKRASSEARNRAALAVSRPSPMKPSGMRSSRCLQQRLDIAAGALLGEPRLHHRRVQLAGHHGVHADALRRVLHGHDARELDHAGLGRGVGDLRRAGPADAGGRRDVDDRAAALPLHHRQHVLAASRNTLFRLKSTCASQTSSLISTGPPARRAADVVHQHVDAAEALEAGFTMAATDGAVGDVALMRGDFAARACHARRQFPSTLSRSRSTAKIFAPSSAKRTAVARPLPQPGPTQPAPVTIAMRSCRRPTHACCPLGQFTRRSEPIEALRIVDQQRLAGCLRSARSRRGYRPARRRRGSVLDDSDAASRCPRRSGRRTPRPACARKARHRNRAAPGVSMRSAPLTFTQTFLSSRQSAAALETWLVKPKRRVDAPHVVDHDRHRRAPERRRQLGDQVGLHVDLQMPADVREALAERRSPRRSRTLAEVRHVVETRAPRRPAASSRLSSASETDSGTSATPLYEPPVAAMRVDRHRIVIAVTAGLHDHAVLDAEALVQLEQQLLRRVGWRVAAIFGERETRPRPEHVHMGVAGASRQFEFWLARRSQPVGWVGRRIGGVLRHASGARVRSNAGSCAENSFSHATQAWVGRPPVDLLAPVEIAERAG